jgi:hypothetical protein
LNYYFLFFFIYLFFFFVATLSISVFTRKREPCIQAAAIHTEGGENEWSDAQALMQALGSTLQLKSVAHWAEQNFSESTKCAHLFITFPIFLF